MTIPVTRRKLSGPEADRQRAPTAARLSWRLALAFGELWGAEHSIGRHSASSTQPIKDWLGVYLLQSPLALDQDQRRVGAGDEYDFTAFVATEMGAS